MVYKVIASGSTGNAVLYHNLILVDCGVPFSLVKPYLNNIQLVLLTHEHHDHINRDTLKKIVFERPSIRVGCCNDWFEILQGRNIDRYEIGKVYDYIFFSISPVKLYHDVPNCGYRIFKDNHKTLHCTDTAHLNGISAKGYDLYALEHNYNEDTVFNDIGQKEQAGEFTYQKNAIKSHLSEQQARKFIFENKGDNYEVLRLHESKIK
jgi:L-ascorbate metabolism protein UlaG (beta-lactamase superfamily)